MGILTETQCHPFFRCPHPSCHLSPSWWSWLCTQCLVDGQVYPGWNPFVATAAFHRCILLEMDSRYMAAPPRVIRKVLNDGLWYFDAVANVSCPGFSSSAANDSNMACHHGGNAGTTALANGLPGSQVTFQWAYWPGDHQGPVSTYMTSCNGDCSTFSANPARWFKVDADGYDPTSREWAAAKLIANNYTWITNIPAGLAPGEYLMRNEIIALHSPEPQFYPSCLQVKNAGSGTGVPSDDQLISTQALYQGVIFPNIDADSVFFTIPGPPPVYLEGGNTSTMSSIIITITQSSTETTPLLGPTPTPPAPSYRCRMASNKLQERNSL